MRASSTIKRIGVVQAARKRGAVRPLGRAAPRCRVRVARVQPPSSSTEPDTRARRRPTRTGSATASRSCRTSSARRPSRRPARRSLRDQRARSRGARGRPVPSTARARRRRTARARSQVTAPELLAGAVRRARRRRRRWRRRRVPARRRARSARRRRDGDGAPSATPRPGVEREDVAPQVLDVGGASVGDRRRHEDARRAVGFPGSRKRHRAVRFPAFPESIDEPGASRVPSRSAFGSGQSLDEPPDPHPATESTRTTATKTLRSGNTGLVR